MKKLCYYVLGAGLLVLALPACNSSSEPDGFDIPPLQYVELTPTEQNAQAGIDLFSTELLNAVEAAHEAKHGKDSETNVSVSPLSVTLAMAMLANTGDDALTEATLKMLHCTDLAALNTLCNKLLRYSASIKGLELANSAWYNPVHLGINSFYVKMRADTYYSDVTGVEFGTEKATALINDWCAGRTHGKITKVLDKTVSEDVFYLVNALYFNDNWRNEFDKSRTTTGEFNGKPVKEVMHNDYMGEYMETDEYRCAEIPFKGNASMMILLPKEGSDITANDIARTYKMPQVGDVKLYGNYTIHLSLPKFEVYNGSNIETILNTLGLPVSVAKLDKMGTLKSDYAVDLKVIHHTSTKVTEKGAEAAAVTVVEGLVSSPGPEHPQGEVIFNVDRPFVYLIVDNHTGATIMAGRVSSI